MALVQRRSRSLRRTRRRVAGHQAGGGKGRSGTRRGPRDWLVAVARGTFTAMETSSTRSLPQSFLSELERKFFWWEPVGSQPRSDARILAQAMSMAGFDEIR